MLIEKHSHIKYVLPIIFLSLIVIVLLTTAVVVANQLVETESMLSSTQSKLSDALTGLEATHTELSATDAELKQARTDILATQIELTNVQGELQVTSDKLVATLDKLTGTEEDFARTKEEIEAERQQNNSLQTNLNDLQVNYDRLTTGYGYVLKDPTYKAIKSFLAADKTDTNKYDINNYVCKEFSADVKANAMQQKIRCAYVTIDYPGGTGHVIVAFNTTDRGVIYIEPQHDDEVMLQIGKKFYQCVIPKPGYYYSKPNYNDTIEKFTVIW